MNEKRLYAVDALRVLAMLSVVFLHAAVSYMTVRMPDLLWGVHDPSAQPFFNGLFFWFRGLTMRIFFLVAGFFAVKIYETAGPRGFLENRGRRVAIPFVVGCGVLLPLIYFVWGYGWVRTGQCDLGQILRLRFDDPIQRNLFGPAHLWFLEFLVIYYAAYFVLKQMKFPQVEKSRWVEKALFSPLRPVLLAVPGLAVLMPDVNVTINFHNTFVPSPFKLLYYWIFFITGVWLYAYRARLGEYRRFAWAYLLFSVPCFAAMAKLLERHVTVPLEGWAYAWLVVSMSLFAWFSIFGFFGLFLQALNRDHPIVRYLSGASYWIYLCHFPVVGIAQVVLLPLPAPAAFKFLTVVLTALSFGLISYEWFVKSTLIGGCLNGPKSRSWAELRPLSLKSRCGLSFCVFFLVVMCGASFQRYYDSERKRYEETVAGYYRKYLHREADPIGLKHWTDWALDRWGLERVEREGFLDSEERKSLLQAARRI